MCIPRCCSISQLVDETVGGVRGRGGRVAIVGDREVASVPGALSLETGLPEALTPLAYVVSGQLIVEATARRMGISPDAPEGLGKVTLTR